MADIVATPVERTSDPGDLRREPKPRPKRAKPVPDGPSKSFTLAAANLIESEEHALDIQA
jgi:hypothetical protein